MSSFFIPAACGIAGLVVGFFSGLIYADWETSALLERFREEWGSE